MIKRIKDFSNRRTRYQSRKQYIENIRYDVIKLADYNALVPPRTLFSLEDTILPLSEILALTPNITCHQCIITHELHHRLTTYFNYLRIPKDIFFDLATPTKFKQIRLCNATSDTNIRFANFMRGIIGSRHVRQIKQLTSVNGIEIHLNDYAPDRHYHQIITPADELDFMMRQWLRELQRAYERRKIYRLIPIDLFEDPMHVKAFLNHSDTKEQLKQYFKTHKRTCYHLSIFDLIRLHPVRTCNTSTRTRINTHTRLRV